VFFKNVSQTLAKKREKTKEMLLVIEREHVQKAGVLNSI
jgi:hypothetical protein